LNIIGNRLLRGYLSGSGSQNICTNFHAKTPSYVSVHLWTRLGPERKVPHWEGKDTIFEVGKKCFGEGGSKFWLKWSGEKAGFPGKTNIGWKDAGCDKRSLHNLPQQNRGEKNTEYCLGKISGTKLRENQKNGTRTTQKE